MNRQNLFMSALILMMAQMISPPWYPRTEALSTSSRPKQQQAEKESDRDWLHFRTAVLDDPMTIGYYEAGDPISITYVGVPFSSYAIELVNSGLRAIPLYSKGGQSWFEQVRIEVYEQVKPETEEYMGRKMAVSKYRVRIKEKKVISREWLLKQTVVQPTEFDLDRNRGYWPKREQYDNFRFVEEILTEFPPMLEPYARAEVVVEILGVDSQPLGPGIYRFGSVFDARGFDIILPESHDKVVSSILFPLEVREVKTLEDQINYRYLMAQHYMKENNLALAEAELIAGTAINPDSTTPWQSLGRFYENHAKDYDKAIAAYEHVKAISERKGLKPPENDMPRMKQVDGKQLFDEPPYWPGTIERVTEKKKRGS